jgi:hypothetical protein
MTSGARTKRKGDPAEGVEGLWLRLRRQDARIRMAGGQQGPAAMMPKG